MTEPVMPMPPLPSSKAAAEDERSVLLGYLDYHRAVLARKVGDITEEQARMATCPPSIMTLLGLIRHMAGVERFWFRRRLVGEDLLPVYTDEGHPDGDPDGDFNLPDDATLADAIAVWQAEIAAADANIATKSVDDYEELAVGGQSVSTLRRVLVHLIEEYARHCGHADLLREAIDGATGD